MPCLQLARVLQVNNQPLNLNPSYTLPAVLLALIYCLCSKNSTIRQNTGTSRSSNAAENFVLVSFHSTHLSFKAAYVWQLVACFPQCSRFACPQDWKELWKRKILLLVRSKLSGLHSEPIQVLVETCFMASAFLG